MRERGGVRERRWCERGGGVRERRRCERERWCERGGGVGGGGVREEVV